MSGGAFLLSFTLLLHARLAPFPGLQILTLSRESSRCGLGLLRYTGYPGDPVVLSTPSALSARVSLYIITQNFDNLVDVVPTGKMPHSCCSSTVLARLVCCGLGFASHLIDLLLDEIRSLRGVLDDLGLFHLYCVKVVLG